MRQTITVTEYKCDVCGRVYNPDRPRSGEVIDSFKGVSWEDNGGTDYIAEDICIPCGSAMFQAFWELRTKAEKARKEKGEENDQRQMP